MIFRYGKGKRHKAGKAQPVCRYGQGGGVGQPDEYSRGGDGQYADGDNAIQDYRTHLAQLG